MVHLQRDRPIQVVIEGKIGDAEATGAEHADDLVLLDAEALLQRLKVVCRHALSRHQSRLPFHGAFHPIKTRVRYGQRVVRDESGSLFDQRYLSAWPLTET